MKQKNERKYLVMDLGGTFVKYALMTEDCRILEKDKFPSVCEPLTDFLASILSVYTKYQHCISGIAISLPGILDSRSGYMYTGGYFSCLSDINLVQTLEKYCSVPVSIANDAKCAGMAELRKGTMKECRNGVVLVCGTGIGGCVIIDGKVISGAHFMAGEFSYPIIEGIEHPQLRNAFGFRCGIHAMMDNVSRKTGLCKEGLTGEIIFSMADEGDEKVLKALREYAGILTLQIHNLQFILDPQRFAVGGAVSVQPLLIKLIREELAVINRQYVQWNIPMPEVMACAFYNDANLIGALYHHLNLFKGEKRI